VGETGDLAGRTVLSTPSQTDTRTDSTASTVERPARHAHAVLHCNLNTVDVERASRLYLAALAGEPRMRSVSTDSDARPMGLGPSTSSVTSFLYDPRGPRAAPALELVGWVEPRTEPAGPDLAPSGFTAIGFRVPSLARAELRLRTIGCETIVMPNGLSVRGQQRPALISTDIDGVTIELVEITPAGTDPRGGALLSHERMRCSDLDRTIRWYEQFGWQLLARGEVPSDDADSAPVRSASLSLPEDPTFSLEFEEQPGSGTRPRPANTQGLYRIALAVEDVRQAHASLLADGDPQTLGALPDPVQIPMPDIPTGGFTVLFLNDPDGAVVELVERPRSAVRRPSEPT
jgi:catechol 2,3-dioxygenase-like lactoylglutathione lyase family enzyme